MCNLFKKILGSVTTMTSLYTNTQVQNANAIFQFFLQKGCSQQQAAAFVGNIEGECSLLTELVGDNDTAFAIFQWHSDRIAEIFKGTGINVKTANLTQQLEAALWELQFGWYRSVWPKFIATKTVQDAVTVLVENYEQSASAASDIKKRVAYANYWYGQFVKAKKEIEMTHGNFYTNIIKKDHRFKSIHTIKDLNLLEPGTRAACQALLKDCRALGHDVRITETYRSQARQMEVFRLGYSHLRKVGCHGYGVAFDVGVWIDGKYEDDGDPYYKFLLPLARKYYLVSGQDWAEPHHHHSFIDYGHFQRIPVSRQGELFRGEFYPPENYNPYEDGAELP